MAPTKKQSSSQSSPGSLWRPMRSGWVETWTGPVWWECWAAIRASTYSRVSAPSYTTQRWAQTPSGSGSAAVSVWALLAQTLPTGRPSGPSAST